MTIFFGVVMALGFFFSQIYHAPQILWYAIIFSIVMNVFSYWKSDTLVIASSGAVLADTQQYRALHNIVENLSITAGLPKPKVYIIDDQAPNAFATGRDPEHGVVAVTTGLLDILEPSELEGVIAHELSHIGNRDILVGTVAVVLVGFVSLLADMVLHIRPRDNEKGNGLIILIGILLAILAPIFATLLQLAVSRKREFLADASGALLTRYPEGLASALEKIAGHAAPLSRANHATAHLFIANPFGGGGLGAKVSGLFSTHPRVEDRIAALRA